MKEIFDIRKLTRIVRGKRMAIERFDVFVCHNKRDVEEAEWLNEELKKRGCTTWFDEEQLKPGTFWQREIERDIPKIRSAVACIGKSGRGPWHDVEMQTLLQEMVKNGKPLIPVIMRDHPSHIDPDIPLFVQNIQIVDTRSEPDPIAKIISGIP